jgi:hypothetical protein
MYELPSVYRARAQRYERALRELSEAARPYQQWCATGNPLSDEDLRNFERLSKALVEAEEVL